MKNYIFKFAIVLASLLFTAHMTIAQGWNTPAASAHKMYGVLKTDGSSFAEQVTQMSKNAGPIFDPFKLPGNGGVKSHGALYIPGLRLHTGSNNVIQFGFAAISTHSELIPMPVPMVRWFARI